VATIGAADIPIELVRRVLDELSYSVFVSGYGLSEAGTLSGTVPGDSVETIATTVGRPRPDFDLRIVDATTGVDVAPGEPGEIVVRGPSVMSHYLDDPEATEAAFADGWLRTGDIGRIEADGNLRIVGRLKDMFIVGGFNAYPAEIENALRRHPDIADAAVIGVPDERLGEVGMAFIVLRSGAATSADEIIAWSRDQMANYKVPRVVEIVDALPLNATGKVEKKELRARAANR
jgi:acyl-CoA synthetase (AMP-forming)/AMP-acid ligase II